MTFGAGCHRFEQRRGLKPRLSKFLPKLGVPKFIQENSDSL